MRWFRRSLLSAGLIIGLALIIAVIVWGRITHWGRSAAGSAELRARLGIVPLIILEPRLYRPFMFHDRTESPPTISSFSAGATVSSAMCT